MKKDKETQIENEEEKQSGEVTRRDFLVGAGTVVVGGTIGAGLLSSCNEGEIVTTTIEKTKTVTTTIGGDVAVTVTETVGGEPGATVTRTTTVNGESTEPAYEEEQTFFNPLGANNRLLVACDVKNDKIIRVRGVHYSEAYTEDEYASAMWKLEARGKTLEPHKMSKPGYLNLTFKKRIYSPRRLRYPMKRIDWEPGGDPEKINPQNRGKSKFKRISWDEATDIIASEIKRVQEKYGAYALLDKSDAGHRMNKTVHGGSTTQYASLVLTDVGFTTAVRNADSWEGWYWGAMHVWGTTATGLVRPGDNLLLDFSENTDMIIYQGCDWETTASAQSGGWPAQVARWYNDLGIKQVYIAPDMNWQNVANPDKWIPVLPNTDAAMQLAIIYTWISEDTYDKEYIATHSVGFDDYIRPYVMGDVDGVPKTPAWASPKCGVKEWTIKALARQWAAKRTSTAHHCGGPFIRGPFCHEPARLECVLLGMQGLGKPGINQEGWYGGPVAPKVVSSFSIGSAKTGSGHAYPGLSPQIIPRPLHHHAILNPPVSSWGTTSLAAPVEDQFIKYTYPLPESEGGCEIHMIVQDHACHINCWNDGNMYIHAIRQPLIECYVIQHPWFENDLLYADIVLPITTTAEEEDIVQVGKDTTGVNYHPAAIKPIGEAKSDYETWIEIAQKLEEFGGVYEGCVNNLTNGETVAQKIEKGFTNSGLNKYITFEEFKERGFFLAPVREDWKDITRGMSAFYEDPVKNPLVTPTGKLEFYSQRLADNFPDDNERGPYPKWIEGGPETTHDERLSGERAKKYPLLLQVNHVRWRLHNQSDDVPWIREIPSCKVQAYDGYWYEPLWINPITAAEYGIKDRDIVKIYNERGTELGGARLTQRIMAGMVYMDHGASIDMIACDEEDYDEREKKWINRGGTVNTISPDKGDSTNCYGMCVSGYLVEIEKLDLAEMAEWMDKYPASFSKKYDPAYGPLPDSWIVGGNE